MKIIFMFGYAEDAFENNFPEGEKFHFLPKPFSLKQLAVAVKKALGRWDSQCASPMSSWKAG